MQACRKDTEEGMGQVQLVNPAHEQQIGVRDRLGPVVQARSAQPEELALAHDGERAVPVDHRFALGSPPRTSAPAKTSRSMVSSPTLARRSRIWRSASSRTGFPLSNTSLRCSSACLRHAAIWVAWTPWRDPSSASVASPRSASRATRALNFAEWFLRERRFMVSTPLHWHYRRYAGAVHPLNAARFFVQKSAATSQFRELHWLALCLFTFLLYTLNPKLEETLKADLRAVIADRAFADRSLAFLDALRLPD